MSCETVKMGRRDSLDLEVALDPIPGVPETGDSPGLEDVLPVLQQADRLHSGNEQDKREGFLLLLNKKLAVRLWLLPLSQPICRQNPVVTDPELKGSETACWASGTRGSPHFQMFSLVGPFSCPLQSHLWRGLFCLPGYHCQSLTFLTGYWWGEIIGI